MVSVALGELLEVVRSAPEKLRAREVTGSREGLVLWWHRDRWIWCGWRGVWARVRVRDPNLGLGWGGGQGGSGGGEGRRRPWGFHGERVLGSWGHCRRRRLRPESRWKITTLEIGFLFNFLTFWVFSKRPLNNLVLPNLPNVYIF